MIGLYGILIHFENFSVSSPFSHVSAQDSLTSSFFSCSFFLFSSSLQMTDNNKKATAAEQSSTWQQWMVDASSAAGSTAAVISEESMKCLKYCIHWLQYAIQHIQQQMNLIRSYLVSLATTSNNNTASLDTIKKEMVSTIRKVVDVITCYASNALPYQAKTAIRGTILTLPSRWVKPDIYILIVI